MNEQSLPAHPLGRWRLIQSGWLVVFVGTLAILVAAILWYVTAGALFATGPVQGPDFNTRHKIQPSTAV